VGAILRSGTLSSKPHLERELKYAHSHCVSVDLDLRDKCSPKPGVGRVRRQLDALGIVPQSL
jgi:hypothetical protein